MTTCNCKNAPGSTQCPDGHVAMCEVVNGICKGVCVPVPSRILQESASELHAWFLTRLLGRNIRSVEVRSDDELASIIRNGACVNPVTGSLVRFSLPKQQTRPRPRDDTDSGSQAGGMMAAG